MRQLLRHLLIVFAVVALTPGAHADSMQVPALPGSYLGEVANNAQVPNSLIASPTRLQSRSVHTATDNISGTVQVCHANWYANGGTGSGEVSLAGTMSANDSIEYPQGVPAFQSSGAIVIASGATGCVSIPNVTIPNGARFWIREDVSNATSGIAYLLPSVLNSPTGGVMNIFTFDANWLTSATTTQEGGPFTAYAPVAILAQTTKRTECLAGDSNWTGFYEGGTNDNTANNGVAERAIAPIFGTVNLALSGETVQGASTAGNYTHRLALANLSNCTDILDGYGINDIAGGRTSAQVVANQTTFAGLFSASVQKHLATLQPDSSSTDNWATVANQTPFAQSTQRIAYNTAIRVGPPVGFTNTIDFASAVESSLNSGRWYPGFVYLTDSNGIHYSQLGAIAASSIVKPLNASPFSNTPSIVSVAPLGFSANYSTWVPITPTVACAVGTITTQTAAERYFVNGSQISVQVKLAISSIGTCTGNLTISVPVAANSTGGTYPASGVNSTTGLSFAASITGSSLTAVVTPAAQNYFVAATYESN